MNKKISERTVGEFFRPNLLKIVFDLIIVVILLYVFFGAMQPFAAVFSMLTIEQQLVDIAVNLVVLGLMFYTPACFLYYLLKKLNH